MIFQCLKSVLTRESKWVKFFKLNFGSQDLNFFGFRKWFDFFGFVVSSFVPGLDLSISKPFWLSSITCFKLSVHLSPQGRRTACAKAAMTCSRASTSIQTFFPLQDNSRMCVFVNVHYRCKCWRFHAWIDVVICRIMNGRVVSRPSKRLILQV